ncbi:MAG: bfd [Rhizobacter sp.]|nr:bfd [Rhizobacter sp.]
MIVCICRRVSDRDIERHARSGCSSFDELQMELGVSTCCGRCADCAREVFDSASASQSHPVSIHRTGATAVA